MASENVFPLRLKIAAMTVIPIAVVLMEVALFSQAHRVAERGYATAIAWNAHALVERRIETLAVRFIAEVRNEARTGTDEAAQARMSLERELHAATAESLRHAQGFDQDEREDETELVELIDAFVERFAAKAVARDREGVGALEAEFNSTVLPRIVARVQEEEAGSANAVLIGRRKAANAIVLAVASGIAIGIASLAVGVAWASSASRSLRCLMDASRRFADGQFKGSIEVWSQDELGAVARSFEHMAATLEATMISRSDLQEKVEDALADLHEAQRQALQSERLAAVGAVVAGVAHEVNNPLSFVISNINFLRARVACLAAGELTRVEVKDVVDSLGEAADGAERVKKIVADLRTLSRGGAEGGGECDPRGALEAAITMAWNQIKHRAQFKRDYSDVPRVGMDEGRLAQVCLNLLVNAVQALPERGDGRIAVSIAQHGGSVAIEVRDSGCGIPETIRDRIFDPFFTTKPPDQGTGLGLPISRRLVEEAGGTIDVESEPGEGTMFRIVLPAAAPDHLSLAV